jgi:hypothetical protein
MAFSYSFALKNLFPEVLCASAATVSLTGAGGGEGAFCAGGFVRVRWGGGRGASSSVSAGAAPFVFPVSCAGGPAGEELPGLVGVGGDATKSLSVSMGPIGWSAMTDILERRFSSSGGRFSGCESRSYFFLEEDLDRSFVGEVFLERLLVDFAGGRLSLSLSREREEVEGFFSGDVGGVGRGEEGWDKDGVSSVGFFADAVFLKRFICVMAIGGNLGR